MPYLNAWIPEAWPIRGDYYHILSTFGGYMGYMVLGYYLRHHPISGKALFKKWLLPSAVIVLTPAYFMNGRYETISNDMPYGYLTINVTLLCILYFTILQLPIPYNSAIHKLSGFLAPQTFGIYLIHIFLCHARCLVASVGDAAAKCSLPHSDSRRCIRHLCGFMGYNQNNLFMSYFSTTYISGRIIV